MSKSKKEKDALRQEQAWKEVDEAVVESASFIGRNLKNILIAMVAILVVVCAYLAYDHFYSAPNNNAAQVAMFKGEEYFREGEDSLAIYGDGNDFIGFEAVIDQYGSTKSGKLAKLYAGISYARLEQYDKAMSYLKGYSSDDKILSHLVNGTIGDCLVQTGKKEEAISYFIKAAKAVDNAVQSPILYKKAGEIYRSQGEHDKVIEIFTLIQDDYSSSPLAMEAYKYIEEAKILKSN